jgi:flavin reductase (DIM6/NTAB) family NADH-FMN oxidoreductase RutF
MNHVSSTIPVTAPGRAKTGRASPVSLLSGWASVIDTLASDAFVNSMRGAATGVNIVTTDGPGGKFGLTVSAFASVSAEPPTVLVCVNRRSPARDAILENGCFGINVLSTTQLELANTFAGRPVSGEPYDFGQGSWNTCVSGSPILKDAAASLDCETATAIESGTHTIFIGHVHSTDHTNRDPLLYVNRSYRRAIRVA